MCEGGGGCVRGNRIGDAEAGQEARKGVRGWNRDGKRKRVRGEKGFRGEGGNAVVGERTGWGKER